MEFGISIIYILLLMVFPKTKSIYSIYEESRTVSQNPTNTASPFFYYPVKLGYIYQDLANLKNNTSIYSSADGLSITSFNILDSFVGSTDGQIQDMKVLISDGLPPQFVVAAELTLSDVKKTALYILDENLNQLYVTTNPIAGEFHALRVLYGNSGFLLALKNSYFAIYDLNLNEQKTVGGKLLSIPTITPTTHISSNSATFTPDVDINIRIFGIFYDDQFFIYEVDALSEYNSVLEFNNYPGGKWELSDLQNDIFSWIGGKSQEKTSQLNCNYLPPGGDFNFACEVLELPYPITNPSVNPPSEIAYTTNENTLLNVYVEEGNMLKYVAIPYYTNSNQNYNQLFLYNDYDVAPIPESPSKNVIFSASGVTVEGECNNYMYKSYSPAGYPDMLFLSKCGSQAIYIYHSKPIWNPKIKLLLNSVEIANHYFPDVPREGATPGSIRSCQVNILISLEELIFSETKAAAEVIPYSKGIFGNNLNEISYSIIQSCNDTPKEILIDISGIGVFYEGADFPPYEEALIMLQIDSYNNYEDYEGTFGLEDKGKAIYGPISFKKKEINNLKIPANSNIPPGEYDLAVRISFFTKASGSKLIKFIYDFNITSHKEGDLIPIGEDLELEIIFFPALYPPSRYKVTTVLNGSHPSSNSTLIKLSGSIIGEEGLQTLSMTTNITGTKTISFNLLFYSQPKIKYPTPWEQITAGLDLGVSLIYDPEPNTYTVKITLKDEQGGIIYTASVNQQKTLSIPGKHLQEKQNYEIILIVTSVPETITSQLSVFVTTIPVVETPDNPISIQIISSNSLGKYNTPISHRFLCKVENEEVRIESYLWNVKPSIPIEVNKEYMEIPPNQLLNDKEYQIECIASHSQNITSKQLIIEASPSITVGQLVIQTGLIIGFETDVNIYATGFRAQSVHLTFLYIAKILGQEEEEYILQDWTKSRSIMTTLMNGIPQYNYTITITLHCRNEYNERVSKSINITSKPSTTKSGVIQMTQIISDVESDTNDQKLIELSKASSLLIQQEEKTTDDCGGCNIYHGYCDNITLVCICKEGYKFSVDCSLSDAEANDLQKSSQILADELQKTSSQIADQSTIWGNEELISSLISSMNIITSNTQINLTSTNQKIVPIMNNFTTYCSAQANKISTGDIQGSLSSILSTELTNKGFNIIDNFGVGITKETADYNYEEATDEKLNNLQAEGITLSNILNKFGICKISAPVNISNNSNSSTEKIEKLTYIWEGGKVTSAQMQNKTFSLNEYEIIMTQNSTANKLNDNSSSQEIAVVNWLLNPLKGYPLSEKQFSNTIEISFYENSIKSDKTLESPIVLKFPFTKKNDTNENNIECVFFNQSINNYSSKGIEMKYVEYSTITEKGIVSCLSTHLSMFTAGYWKTSGTQIKNSGTQNNLSEVPEEDEILDYNPLDCYAFYASILVFLGILITWVLYRYRENKEFKKNKENPLETLPQEKAELLENEVADKEKEVGEPKPYENEGKLIEPVMFSPTQIMEDNKCETVTNLIDTEDQIKLEVVDQGTFEGNELMISERMGEIGDDRPEERHVLDDEGCDAKEEGYVGASYKEGYEVSSFEDDIYTPQSSVYLKESVRIGLHVLSGSIGPHYKEGYVAENILENVKNVENVENVESVENVEININIEESAPQMEIGSVPMPSDTYTSINTPQSELLVDDGEPIVSAPGVECSLQKELEEMGKKEIEEETKTKTNVEEIMVEEKENISLESQKELKENVPDEIKVENICLQIEDQGEEEFQGTKLPELSKLNQLKEEKEEEETNAQEFVKYNEYFQQKTETAKRQEARTIKILPPKPHNRYLSILFSVHNWFSPFVERQAWYRRSDRILVLGAYILITLWSTGIFWDPQEKSRMQDSFTYFGYICITLICIMFSALIIMILKKLLCSIGASLENIESGIIHPPHKIRRIIGYVFLIFVYLGCLIHINIMAVLFQAAATREWMIVWFILVIENVFILQPMKAMLICLIYSPDLCHNPIGFLTGMKFASSSNQPQNFIC